ncbi:MAG: glycosyltransferase family 4 protein [Candidatus Auribacterota bacterium]|nr:glycosyltransferase family 4 protein [Candidatus Auribacterota bacterium]
MQVLFFSHYFPPEVNAPASRTYANCKRWVKAGHRVTVITGAPNCPDGVVYKGYRNRLFQRELQDGIEVIRVWTYLAANKGTFFRIINYLSYMFSAILASLSRKKPDIMIATSPQFFCGWAGIIAGRLRNVPLLLEIRDIWPESIIAVGAIKNKTIIRFLEWWEMKMYRASRHIITVGEGYRKRLLEKGIPAQKISVVMNGVDKSVFFPRPPDLELKKRLGISEKFVCSYVGTIGLASGLEVVLQAAILLREINREDIVFLLVGSGAMREKLEAESTRLGISNVIFTGRLEKSEMPAILSISDAVLVHLKKTDLFATVMPSKLFEASGMGRPIICGVPGYASRLVEESGGGICIEPDNPGQLVDTIEVLANNLDWGKKMGKSGHKFITARFDRDYLAKKYLSIIAVGDNIEK